MSLRHEGMEHLSRAGLASLGWIALLVTTAPVAAGQQPLAMESEAVSVEAEHELAPDSQALMDALRQEVRAELTERLAKELEANLASARASATEPSLASRID